MKGRQRFDDFDYPVFDLTVAYYGGPNHLPAMAFDHTVKCLAWRDAAEIFAQQLANSAVGLRGPLLDKPRHGRD